MLCSAASSRCIRPYFTVKEASADKAYLSNANLDLIDGLGGTPFIPFKVNSQEDGPALWQRMFHYFNFHRKEFLQHYHKRSNIESTFSMIKAKFRDPDRAKTDPAMKNEVLAKVICHNTCCAISSWYELGIEPGFGARVETAQNLSEKSGCEAKPPFGASGGFVEFTGKASKLRKPAYD